MGKAEDDELINLRSDVARLTDELRAARYGSDSLSREYSQLKREHEYAPKLIEELRRESTVLGEELRSTRDNLRAVRTALEAARENLAILEKERKSLKADAEVAHNTIANERATYIKDREAWARALELALGPLAGDYATAAFLTLTKSLDEATLHWEKAEDACKKLAEGRRQDQALMQTLLDEKKAFDPKRDQVALAVGTQVVRQMGDPTNEQVTVYVRRHAGMGSYSVAKTETLAPVLPAMSSASVRELELKVSDLEEQHRRERRARDLGNSVMICVANHKHVRVKESRCFDGGYAIDPIVEENGAILTFGKTLTRPALLMLFREGARVWDNATGRPLGVLVQEANDVAEVSAMVSPGLTARRADIRLRKAWTVALIAGDRAIFAEGELALSGPEIRPGLIARAAKRLGAIDQPDVQAMLAIILLPFLILRAVVGVCSGACKRGAVNAAAFARRPVVKRRAATVLVALIFASVLAVAVETSMALWRRYSDPARAWLHNVTSK